MIHREYSAGKTIQGRLLGTLAVFLLLPAAIYPVSVWGIQLDRWATASQCQSLSGRPGEAELQQIYCHREQISKVRFLHGKTQEVRSVIQAIRGRITGPEQDICIWGDSDYRKRVPTPVEGGVCSQQWRAIRNAYEQLRKETCNMGSTTLGEAVNAIYLEVDRRVRLYRTCFDNALGMNDQSYGDIVKMYGLTSREDVKQTWENLEKDYLKHQDRYLSFYKAHVKACNETLKALARTSPRLIEQHNPSCRISENQGN